MSELQDKYASVISAAQSAGVSNLQVSEQDGILYVSGHAANTAAKDAVWKLPWTMVKLHQQNNEHKMSLTTSAMKIEAEGLRGFEVGQGGARQCCGTAGNAAPLGDRRGNVDRDMVGVGSKGGRRRDERDRQCPCLSTTVCHRFASPRCQPRGPPRLDEVSSELVKKALRAGPIRPHHHH